MNYPRKVANWTLRVFNLLLTAAATAAGTTLSTMYVTDKETLNFTSDYNFAKVLWVWGISTGIIFFPLFAAYIRQSPFPLLDEETTVQVAAKQVVVKAAKLLVAAGLLATMSGCASDASRPPVNLQIPLGESGRYGRIILATGYLPPPDFTTWPISIDGSDFKEVRR